MIAEKLYLKPISVNEAVRFAAEHENDFRFIAGGTDLMVNKFQGNDGSNCLIDITSIAELKKVNKDDKNLNIGSLVRLDELKSYSLIVDEIPVLLDAAKAVASPMIRKSATLGGNLMCENRCIFYNQSEWWKEAVGYCLKCNGDICIATGGKKNCFSKFVSDTAVALISLGAVVYIQDKEKSYSLPLEDLYSGDGVNSKKLDETSLIKTISVPLSQGFRSVFKKLRQRETLEFGSLTTAVSINKNGKIKIVLGGVDPKPVVVEGNIGDDKAELIKQAVKKARLVDNDVYSRKYRKEMIAVYLNRSFSELT